jgi:putative aldouronate transport system substrate-binding protein
VPGSGGTVTMLTISYSPPPTDKDKNTFWQELEKRLGVQWEPTLVPASSSGATVSALIAGGDLPDLFFLLVSNSAPVIAQSMSQGAFTDLTPYLTGDAIGDYPNLAKYPSYLWENVKFEGKIFGVPKPVLRSNDTQFYRTDWAQKLGMEAVATTDEVSKLLVAMSKDDPDGNGSGDTWGVAASSGSWNMFTWNQMFAVPYSWRLNDDGTLTNQIETEEYRASLSFARDLYANGAFHPDSAGMDYDTAKSTFISGHVGLYGDGFAAFFGENSLQVQAKKLNPDAAFAPLVSASANGVPGVTYAGPGYFGSMGIPASVTDEGRVRELLRIMDYLCAPFGSEESNFLRYGLTEHHDVQPDGSFVRNDKGAADMSALVYPFLSENFFFYPGLEGEAASAQALNEQMATIAITNPTAGLISATNIEKAGELNQLGTDRVTAIVTGRADLGTLDDYINEWKQGGGDAIRQEFEQAIAAKSGS